MICWINKIETNLQYVSRNQWHVIFAKVRHDQLCQRSGNFSEFSERSHKSLTGLARNFAPSIRKCPDEQSRLAAFET